MPKNLVQKDGIKKGRAVVNSLDQINITIPQWKDVTQRVRKPTLVLVSGYKQIPVSMHLSAMSTTTCCMQCLTYRTILVIRKTSAFFRSFKRHQILIFCLVPALILLASLSSYYTTFLEREAYNLQPGTTDILITRLADCFGLLEKTLQVQLDSSYINLNLLNFCFSVT